MCLDDKCVCGRVAWPPPCLLLQRPAFAQMPTQPFSRPPGGRTDLSWVPAGYWVLSLHLPTCSPRKLLCSPV